MKNQYILVFGMVMILFGCSTMLSTQGGQVRVISDKETIANCKFINTVSGFHTMSWTTGGESENAMNEARNRAAEMGANTMRILHMQSTNVGTSVKAEALNCSY